MFFSFLASEEVSLWEELWTYFEEKYLTPQYGNYEHITINHDPLISPAMIFIAVFVAVMTASIIMIFNRRTLGRAVRRLMSRGAVGYENAKTMDEIELSSSLPIKLFINRYTLMRAVRCREEDDFYGIDPKDAPKLESSIGIENTDKIKVPLWRRGRNATLSNIEENPCGTSISENLSNEAEDVNVADDTQSPSKCDAENPASHQEANSVKSNADAAQCDADAKDEKPRFRTAYDASLVSPKKYKRNFEKDHFYILEAETHKLRIKFDKKGTNPLGLIFVALFVIVAGLLIIRFLPWILSRFDEILGGFDSGY